MLKRLKLHQFRYIKPGTELSFTEHFNVLLGRNGTGKTTLLDLLSMVLRSDFSALREEEFDIEYEYTHEKPSSRNAHTKSENSPREGGKSRRLQPHLVIQLRLDRIENNSEVDVEVSGAAMRWRRGGGKWEKLGSVDVFEESALESLEEAIPSLDQRAIDASMAMSLAVQRSWKENDGLWWSFGRAEFLFSGLGGVEFSHNYLSYGQKRLLAFLFYLDANATFVIADELVNGMHHDWIRACLDQIGTRQAFLTSQNPLMLDYLPLESAEQVQKSFIQCRAEVVDDTTQLVWSNLAAEDADELFADYQVGIQHVGEILRVRGLW